MMKDKDYYNIYEMNTKGKIDGKHINKKKVVILIIMIIILIGLILIAKNSTDIIGQHKMHEEYVAQVESLKKEEELKQAELEKQKQEEEEKQRQEKLPKLTDEGRQNMQNIYHSETKRAFLTFDDGPSTVTPTILDTLKQEDIKATFFVLGSRVDAMPDMVKRIYDEGHYIANHGYTHTYSAIYSSPQAVLDEYNRCNDSVRNALGEQEYNSHLFRYPGGLPGGPYVNVKNQAKELLEQNDIVNVDWNALSGDAETTTPTVEYEMQKIQQTVTGKSSVVILMHDAQAKKVTAEALPQIISWLRENGYEFKSFYEIIK